MDDLRLRRWAFALALLRPLGYDGPAMESAKPTPGTLHTLDRRAFIALVSGGLLAAPLTAEAQQQAGKIARVGYLTGTPKETLS